MDSKTVQVSIMVVGKVITTLALCEMLGGAVSRPIAAWRIKQNVSYDNVASLIEVMNQRICTLEEKVLGESK